GFHPRLCHCPAYSANVARGIAGSAGIALPRTTSPRIQEVSDGQVAANRDGPRSQVLRTHRQRPCLSQRGNRELETTHGCRRPHSQGDIGGSLMNWFWRLFSRERMDVELDKELRFHIESQVADKIRSGTPEHEACRLA